MVSNLDLSTLIAQIPEAQKIQQTLLVQAEFQQTLAQQMDKQHRQQAKKKVPKTDASATESHVTSENGGQAAENRQLTGRHAQNKDLEDDQKHLVDTQV